jgi:hypothetical protein
MKNLKFHDADIHNTPQGKIHIVHADHKFSLGYLELQPHQQMEKMSLPVDQEIIQLKGMSDVLVFHDSEEPEQIVLHPGDYLGIPAHTYFIHDNPNDEVSLSSWKLDGDASHVIKEIREKYPKI